MAGKQRPRRAPGSGAIIHRSDGKWVARVSLGVVDGRRRSMERWAPDEDRARDALAELLAIVGAGVDPGDPKTTLDAYLRDWLVHVKATKSASTYVAYKGHVDNHISPLLGGMVVRKIRPADVRRLVRDRTDAGLSPTTVRAIIGTLGGALKVAVRDGRLARNPVTGIELPRHERTIDDPIDEREARAILAAVSADVHGPEYALLLFTGLRRGELLGLRWRDIDIDGATLTTRVQRRPGEAADLPLKTRQSRRTIPLAPQAVEILRTHRAKTGNLDPDARVFMAAPSTLSNHFRLVLERRSLRHRRLHDLRHAFATLMLRTGSAQMEVVSSLLGHADLRTTAIYGHVIPASSREATDRFDVLLREAK